MIRFEGVARTFVREGAEPVHAVRELDLEVARGETLCLIGSSGCGKTTTLRLVNRLLDVSAGRVLVGGEEVAAMDPIALRRRMGYVIQSGGLFPHMTVERNVGLLCRIEGWSADRRAARVRELLELVDLPPAEFAPRFPHELSGGQSQRVGVARALALDPEIVLMDEPFGALDPVTRESLQSQFLELEEHVQKTVVLVTHDLEEAFRLGDRVALMRAGRLEQVGTREDFLDAPRTEYVRQFVAGYTHAR